MEHNATIATSHYGSAELVELARTLCVSLAERHGLRCDLAEDDPVDFACTYPAQPGLDFDLWFALSGDEVTCGGADWHLDIFPVDDPALWETVSITLEGLITGEARALRYMPLYAAVARESILDGRAVAT